jgi:hypothetical protein
MSDYLLDDVLYNFVDRENKSVVGVTTSYPALLKSDGLNLTYTVNVMITFVASQEEMKNVPIAEAAGAVFYADVGSAVQLTKIPLTGKYEVTGFSKFKPGFLRRYAVDCGTGLIGAVVVSTLSTRMLSLGELKSYGGGFGSCPLSAFGLFRGTTLVELRW